MKSIGNNPIYPSNENKFTFEGVIVRRLKFPKGNFVRFTSETIDVYCRCAGRRPVRRCGQLILRFTSSTRSRVGLSHSHFEMKIGMCT